MLKSILSDLYLRVFVANKTTFLGFAIVAADVIVQGLNASSNPIVHGVAAVAGALLVFYKGKALPPPAVP